MACPVVRRPAAISSTAPRPQPTSSTCSSPRIFRSSRICRQTTNLPRRDECQPKPQKSATSPAPMNGHGRRVSSALPDVEHDQRRPAATSMYGASPPYWPRRGSPVRARSVAFVARRVVARRSPAGRGPSAAGPPAAARGAARTRSARSGCAARRRPTSGAPRGPAGSMRSRKALRSATERLSGGACRR